MASVKANRGNLPSAPWEIVGSLHHMTSDVGPLQGHTGLWTLPLSGHKLCPLQAFATLHPDVSYMPFLPNTPLHFFCPFPRLAKLLHPKLQFLSPIGLLCDNVRGKQFHSVPWALRSTLPFPSCFLYNLKFWLDNCSACHLLQRWYFARLILWPWRWRRYVHPKHWLTFNILYGVISQKTNMLLYVTSSGQMKWLFTIKCFTSPTTTAVPTSYFEMF
jgi:hypothetical protein